MDKVKGNYTRAKIWVMTLEDFLGRKRLHRQHKSGEVGSQVQTNQPMQEG